MMSENFFNNSLNTNFTGSFGRKLFPERTMKQVKDTAINLLKDIVKPITDIGVGREEVLNGNLQKQLNSYNKIMDSVCNTMAAADKYAFKSLDVKS